MHSVMEFRTLLGLRSKTYHCLGLLNAQENKQRRVSCTNKTSNNTISVVQAADQKQYTGELARPYTFQLYRHPIRNCSRHDAKECQQAI